MLFEHMSRSSMILYLLFHMLRFFDAARRLCKLFHWHMHQWLFINFRLVFSFCRLTQCIGAAFAMATWLSCLCVCHIDVLCPND